MGVKGHENKRNDHPLKKPLIVTQILPIENSVKNMHTDERVQMVNLHDWAYVPLAASSQVLMHQP